MAVAGEKYAAKADEDLLIGGQDAEVSRGVEVRGEAAGLDSHQVATYAVHHRLEDRDAVKYGDSAAQNEAADATNNHGQKDRNPTAA